MGAWNLNSLDCQGSPRALEFLSLVFLPLLALVWPLALLIACLWRPDILTGLRHGRKPGITCRSRPPGAGSQQRPAGLLQEWSEGLRLSTGTLCHLSGSLRVLFCLFQASAMSQETVDAR